MSLRFLSLVVLLCSACGSDYTPHVLECVASDLDGDGYAGAWLLEGGIEHEVCAKLDVPDCNDHEDSVHPAADEVCDGLDNDCDGNVDPDMDGDGWAACAGDCDDQNPVIHPEAVELCNNVDDDCDGYVDDELDQDGDGFRWCAGDCDDQNPSVYWGAPELCDGVDNDCDGEFLDGGESDYDGDGYLTCSGDCDDWDPSVNPGAEDICNGIDDNCDGVVAQIDSDLDGDGFLGCEECDDTDPLVNPGAPELCDGLNNDCDDQIDEDFDVDGDGYTTCGGDCDDTDASIYPSAPELCNRVDDDCDGVLPQDEWDLDGDGYSECELDCAPLDPAISPAATEVCNGLDDDCNGLLPADEVDLDADGGLACEECDDSDPFANILDLDRDGNTSCDGDCDDLDSAKHDLDFDADGVSLCDGDCDDGDPERSPLLTEVCDFVDNDCDGEVDEGFVDLDGDGAAECVEICNGLDDDSDGTIDEGYSDGSTTGTWVDGTMPSGGEGTWASPYSSIQAAIDGRSPESPCTIYVLPATYWESLWVDGGLIELESVSGPDVTIIDAAGSWPTLGVESSLDGSRVEGFTITGAEGYDNGGGVVIQEGYLEVTDNIVEGNTTDGAGAGIYCRDCTGTISGNEIRDNESVFGAFDYGMGGGIGVMYSGASVSIEDNVIEGNYLSSTYGFGGGIGVWSTDEVWIRRNLIIDNTSSYAGGGVSVRDGAVAYLENNIITGNAAGFVYGGAAGVELQGDDGAWMVNNTIVGNHDGWAQVAVSWSATSSYLANNIIASSDIAGLASHGGTAPTIVYCDVYGNAGGNYLDLTDVTGTNGNISLDPLFVDYSDDGDASNDDLTLDASSPCVDAGHSNTGFDDVDGTQNDMGAYGGPEGSWP